MDTCPDLFTDGSEIPAFILPPQQALLKREPRVQMPNRNQLELRPSDLESLLPEGHRARIVWGYVERQDKTGLYAGIKAVEGGAGRAAIAPKILFALWLYATLEGVGSARAIARLTQEHDAYRWICGGVQVNYHIVGVEVATTGSDMGQMAPMVAQVVERCGQAPENWLVDGGFPAHDQIDAVAAQTRVIAPVPKPKTKAKAKDNEAGTGVQVEVKATPEPAVDPYQRKPGDSPAVGDWRERMATEGAKEQVRNNFPILESAKNVGRFKRERNRQIFTIAAGGLSAPLRLSRPTARQCKTGSYFGLVPKELYKERAATAECVNAQARNRGLVLLPVRGLAKVKGVALLFVLAHNLMRMLHLAPELIGIGTGTSAVPGMAG